jgi:hypothetical protein
MPGQRDENPADALDAVLTCPTLDSQSMADEIDHSMSVGLFRGASAHVPLRPVIIPGDLHRAIVDVAFGIRRIVVAECNRRARCARDLAALVNPDAPKAALWTEHPMQVRWATSMARPDILLANGVPQVLELNVNSAMGGAPQVPRLERIHWRRPDIRAVANKWPLWSIGPGPARDDFLRLVGSQCRQGHPPTIAVVGWEDSVAKGREAAFAEVIEGMRSHGLPALYAQPVDLKVHRGRAYARGVAVDILLRHFTTPDAESSSLVPLREVLEANAAILLSPDPGLLYASKLTLAWLWESIDEMSEGDREFIRKHVPYTWELGPCRGDDKDYASLLAQRDDWVIKPCTGHSGDGVLIGAETPVHGWAEAVRRARVTGGFIAQRAVESDLFPIAAYDQVRRTVSCVPHRVNFGAMLYGNESGGIFARHMPARQGMLIGAFRGASANCVFAWETDSRGLNSSQTVLIATEE